MFVKDRGLASKKQGRNNSQVFNLRSAICPPMAVGSAGSNRETVPGVVVGSVGNGEVSLVLQALGAVLLDRDD